MHDPLPLPLAMLIIFGSAKLLAELFERIGQPGIVGEILAGALVGPSVLGWIAPNDTLKALSDLGVLFLLFGVGMEVKASELLKVGGKATLVATIGVIFPFFAGWGILFAWGAPQLEAIFVGASMVATSVGITASVLSARGVLHEVASKVILAAAVIDDVLGLIVLAVVSSVARGRVNLWEIALVASLATAFTVVMAIWGTTAVKRVLPIFGSRARADEAEFHIALAFLFAMALLAQYTGVAAIVGAFLAGLALSDSSDARMRTLTRGVSELLVPFFLAGIGLHLNFGVFRSRSTIALALVILAAAVVTKLVGCGLGAISLGWQNMLKIGLGMVPRGEVGMVVAQLGLGMAVISTEVYSVVVFMAVATTLLTPLLLKIAFRTPALVPAEV
ncbi:MAG TPA: cation:proton antiporter [Candidatus Limnocylindria bacterium]|jgi:Kef-type K+ transport system membrane component KefB|nr:cation:proton antiporter [Candidatus Limnocylindria bacterium]